LSRIVIGQRFGNYRAISLLGEGGMGAVYLAEHPEIGRRVAVKVLRAELIKDPQLLVRFLNEARAANAIRHPNIIEILDSGTTPTGTPYLVMELLEGEVLSARIRRLGRLPLGEALELAYQTASALSAAHNKGIIHRDLKPDNLFVITDPTDPSREKIKVLDFGIAKLQTLSSGSAMQTRTGTMMGTPVYMSPEQCLGTKAIDPRSDIYALGVILFEMLEGRPPFISEGFGELVNMHLNVRAPALRDLNPAVPVPVSALVAKALEKAPDARHASAADLQNEIRSAAGKSILIRGVSSPDLASATLPGVASGTARPFAGSTTLSTGTGERIAVPVGALGSAPVSLARRSGARSLVIGVVVVIAVIAGGTFAMSRRGVGPDAEIPSAHSTGPSAAAVVNRDSKPVAPVHVTIESHPPGATVTDIGSGTILGTTPVVIERSGPAGSMEIRVEKSGFVSAIREVELNRDRVETVSLETVSREAEPVGNAHPAEKSKKVGRARHQANRTEDEPAKL
jgi:hypothetical protein